MPAPPSAAPGVFSPAIAPFTPITASPAVAVVMTTWNDIRFMRGAVDSILAQTMRDFEFIIVDDGSDHPVEVAALCALDPRIRTIRLDRNMGPGHAYAIGIAEARAPLIASMGYDDLAEPAWLAQAVAAFAADPELGLFGTAVTLISEHGDPLGIDRPPESDFAIRFTLLSHNPFYHSSTLFRRELLERTGGIEAEQRLTYDHRLWRALLPHCRARNLPQALCRYRYNTGGLTGTSDPLTRRSRSRDIRVGLWREFGLDYPLEDQALGDAVDDFLRDRPARDPALWGEVGKVIELAIAAAGAKARDFVRPGDEAEAEAFVRSLQQRLADGPKAPPGLVERLLAAILTRGLRRTLAAAGRKTRRRLA